MSIKEKKQQLASLRARYASTDSISVKDRLLLDIESLKLDIHADMRRAQLVLPA